MEAASCSGATPFKRLVDQQSRDVSHHQDRLLSHNSQPQNSFRSVHQHQANGTHDSFGAFIHSSPSNLSGPSHDPAGRLAAHVAALQPSIGLQHASFPRGPDFSPHARSSPMPEASNWAADFNRLSPQNQLQSSSTQQHQQHPYSSHPMQMNFQNAFSPQLQSGFSPFFAPAGAAYTNAAQTGEADFDQEMARWMANNGNGNGNMEHVDAAMDKLARELELNEATLAQAESQQKQAEQQQEQPATQSLDEQTAHFSDLGVPEIGNLSLEPPDYLMDQLAHEQMIAPTSEQEQEQEIFAGPKNKSAVSEAAERLLESVQHENGDKWQNSVFLSLMRDFRDGRKDIVDNEVRQVDGDVNEGPSSGNGMSSAATQATM